MNIYTLVGAIFLLLLGLYGIFHPDLTTKVENRVRSILGLSTIQKPKLTEREHKWMRISSIGLIMGSILGIILEINKL